MAKLNKETPTIQVLSLSKEEAAYIVGCLARNLSGKADPVCSIGLQGGELVIGLEEHVYGDDKQS